MCNPCYSTLRRNAHTCPGCGQAKILAFFDEHKRIVCASCVGRSSRFGCKTCGSEEQLTGSACGTCRLKERATALLTGNDGLIHVDLVGLYEHLLSAPDKRSVTRWLRRDGVHQPLREMALGTAPIAHSTLNRYPRTPRIRYLRQVLISAGTLPAIDVELNDFETYVVELLATLPPSHATIVGRYYRWHVLRFVRKSAATRPLLAGVASVRRHEIRVIVGLLSWLDSGQLTLQSMKQRDLDYYLTHVSAVHNRLRTFISWATKHKLAHDVVIVSLRRPLPQSPLSDDERWRHVDRLLAAESVTLSSRIIGLFVLVFAQNLSRCVRLRNSEFTINTDSVSVQFASDPVKLPLPIAVLVRRHFAEPASLAIYRSAESDWTFHGATPTTHVTPSSVRRHLSSIGISNANSKSAAKRQLSIELPARVMADTLGVPVSTATRWSQLSGGTWSDYPHLRNKH